MGGGFEREGFQPDAFQVEPLPVFQGDALSLVLRAIAAHNGGQYQQATVYLLAAILVNNGFDSGVFTTMKQPGRDRL